MKPRLLAMLLVCVVPLAGCYRQTEEPFQQVDSADVVEAATSAVAVADSEVSDDTAAGGESGTETGTTTQRRYITPEALPGQIEQPTVELPTSEADAEATAPVATLEPFLRPSPTETFEEQLDPDDECVYQVQAGNVLFRLALAWGTTYQTIMEVNQLDSENLAIGQLLRIPDCEPSVPDESVPDDSAAAEESTPGPVISESDAETESSDSEASTAPTVEAEPTATPRPEVHVVSAGETIESISLRYRVDVNELIDLNELANPNQLSVGQELKLPQ